MVFSNPPRSLYGILSDYVQNRVPETVLVRKEKSGSAEFLFVCDEIKSTGAVMERTRTCPALPPLRFA
jgi:hypothetical protein